MKNTSWSISPSPFILTRPTVSRMSIIAIATLVPQILALAIENDVAALCIVAVSLAGCVIAQLFASIPEHKNPFSDGTVILSGLLVGLLLPDTLNPVVAFAASFSGFLVARIVFGGNGSYWVHPVAVSVCIAWISQAALFSGPARNCRRNAHGRRCVQRSQTRPVCPNACRSGTCVRAQFRIFGNVRYPAARGIYYAFLQFALGDSRIQVQSFDARSVNCPCCRKRD